MVQIGRIVKAQGLRGEVKLELETRNADALDHADMLYLTNERGDYYPVRINTVRTEFQSGTLSFFVHFEQIADRNAAELLKGKAVYADEHTASLILDEHTEESLFDFDVLNDLDEFVGMVSDVMDSGAQVVLTVATTRGSLMIPLVDEYVTSVDKVNGIIRCHNLDLLEGL